MKAIFTGAISFGLVNIPVRIYTATDPKEMELHLFCNTSNTKLKYLRWCPECKKSVPWEDVVRGFELSKENWVFLQKDELDRIDLASTKTLEVENFVDMSRIDPLYFEKTYYIVPEKSGVKPYSLLVDALRLVNKAAVGKIVFKNREHLVCLRPFRKGLAMHTLYYAKEIRNIDRLPELESLAAVSREDLELAITFINTLTESDFEPEKYKDRYVEALKKLVQSKTEGKELEIHEEKPIEEIKNLTEALKVSIENVRKKKKA